MGIKDWVNRLTRKSPTTQEGQSTGTAVPVNPGAVTPQPDQPGIGEAATPQAIENPEAGAPVTPDLGQEAPTVTPAPENVQPSPPEVTSPAPADSSAEAISPSPVETPTTTQPESPVASPSGETKV